MTDMTKVVAKLSELEEGKMKQVRVGKTFVVLTKIDGRVHAVGGKCPHYGALLARGVLCGHRIVCPWHSAAFDARNGDLLDPPALDGLPCYEVLIEGDDVSVIVPEEAHESRTLPMAEFTPEEDRRTFAILGGGAAAASAAEALRQEGFKGRIVLVNRENRLPYDRPPFSKDYLAGRTPVENLPLRKEEFYIENDISLIHDRVVEFDVTSRTITLEGQPSFVADAVLIATGADARRLNSPGADLSNIHTLRSWDDGDAIRNAIGPDVRLVIVGASFIGTEAASGLAKKVKSVTVVAPESAPLERLFGREVGGIVREMHEKNGVVFNLGRTLRRFCESDDKKGIVGGVELDNGEIIPAEMVLVGVGAKPATSYIRGFPLNKDGGIDADDHLRVADGVYAAGDVAAYPDPYNGGRVRIEHWKLAMQQGRTAARNMLGREEPFTSVPFFWSDQYGVTIGYAGHASAWDEVILQKDAKGQFMAYYANGGRLLAAAGTKGEQLGAFLELMRLGCLPGAEDMRRGGELDLVRLL